jgi:murein endopeptidase
MKIYLESRNNRLLKDSVSVVERVAELQQLPASVNYTQIGGTCGHHGPSDNPNVPQPCRTPNNNHWATATVNMNIENIAAEYRRSFPNLSPLAINDMSLPHGGRFDIDGRWAGNRRHQHHRNGQDVDIRSTTMTGDLFEDINENDDFDPEIDRFIVDRNNNGQFDPGSLYIFLTIARRNQVSRTTLEFPEQNEEHWHLYFWSVEMQ